MPEITDRHLIDGLERAVPAPAPHELAELRGRLARAAGAADLLDVAYRIVDSPIGPLLVAVTAEGLVRVAFHNEHHEQVLVELARTISPRVLQASERTDPVARQLDDYFAGRRHHFDLPVDLRLASGFHRQVLAELRLVGYGRTVSYADLARAAGSPRAVRAVGTACARNPVPVVVPCHRVVRSDGAIGNYRGGIEAKATLLALEAAA